MGVETPVNAHVLVLCKFYNKLQHMSLLNVSQCMERRGMCKAASALSFVDCKTGGSHQLMHTRLMIEEGARVTIIYEL